jgi:hypothetical protein
MKHGILNALRQTQAQDDSLESLSQLPQIEIMRMVQNGLIEKNMLLPIMSKKAEMADQSAKLNAVKKGGGQQQASILEKKMAQIAQAENPVNIMQAGMQPQMQAQAPMTAENTGVAQLPIPERTYAGGGIVAFKDNEDQPVNYKMPSRDDEGNRMPYNPSQGAPEYIGDLPEYLGSKLGPFFSGMREQINTGKVTPGATFNPSKQAPPTIATAPIPAQARKEPGIVIHDNKGTKGKPGIANALRDADIQAQTQGPSELSQALALMRKDLEGGAEERKEARRDARNLRLAQAGAGIAGGTSPYFFTNVGQGAAPAIQGYGEDIKGIRAEDADRRKQLASLGLKGIELKQAEKELGAKMPLYSAQTEREKAYAAYLRSGGKGGGAGYGNLTGKDVNTMLGVVDEFANAPNPQSPLWKLLPKTLQEKFTIAKPGNPIYEQGKVELAQMMPQIERTYLARTAQYTGKRGVASLTEE